MDREIKCKRCGSSHIVAHGSVTTVKSGERERCKCQNCGHTFYRDENKKVGDK
jgi:transposase-like protein